MISFAGIIQIKFNRLISERLPLSAVGAKDSVQALGCLLGLPKLAEKDEHRCHAVFLFTLILR